MTPFRILCTAGLFAILSSTLSKSPVLPLFAAHLGADAAGVGAVASVSALTGALFSIPAGILADRFGRRRMLLCSAVVFAVVPFLYLLVSQIWHLAVVRFLHGFATAIFLPVGMAFVSDLFHTERGEKLGWFSSATLLGRFAAPIIGGTILSLLAMHGGYRFSAVYLVCGAAGIITLLMVMRIPQAEERHHREKSWRGAWVAFRSVITSRAIIITSMVEAAILFVYGTFETFLPLYAVKSGISEGEVGIFLSAQVITLALSKPVMGRLSDRHGRKPQILFGSLLASGCMALFAFAGSFGAILGVSIMLGLCLSVVTSATSALIADLCSCAGRGSAMGILGSIMDIGHTTGPLVTGFIAAGFGFRYAFLASAGLLAIMAAVFLLFMGRTALYPYRKEETYGTCVR